MGLINHVTRRPATYVWRRRLAAPAGPGSVQVSLRTTVAREARRIAAVVTLNSEQVFLDMADDKLTREQAKALLDEVVRAELDKSTATARSGRVTCSATRLTCGARTWRRGSRCA